jgi:hypothetical protein
VIKFEISDVRFGTTYRDKLGFVIDLSAASSLPVWGMSQPPWCRSVVGERPPVTPGRRRSLTTKQGKTDICGKRGQTDPKTDKRRQTPTYASEPTRTDILGISEKTEKDDKDDKDGKIGNVRIVGKSRKSLDCRETSGNSPESPIYPVLSGTPVKCHCCLIIP